MQYILKSILNEPLAFVLGIHHYWGSTRLVSKLHNKTILFLQAIVLNHHKRIFYLSFAFSLIEQVYPVHMSEEEEAKSKTSNPKLKISNFKPKISGTKSQTSNFSWVCLASLATSNHLIHIILKPALRWHWTLISQCWFIPLEYTYGPVILHIHSEMSCH